MQCALCAQLVMNSSQFFFFMHSTVSIYDRATVLYHTVPSTYLLRYFYCSAHHIKENKNVGSSSVVTTTRLNSYDPYHSLLRSLFCVNPFSETVAINLVDLSSFTLFDFHSISGFGGVSPPTSSSPKKFSYRLPIWCNIQLASSTPEAGKSKSNL